MVMMACFAVFRLDQRQLILLPGNLAVAGGLIIGAVAVALNRPFSLPVGLASAALTAVSGVYALFSRGSGVLNLPGYPLIWVVIGSYIAFRLLINQQHQQRLRRNQSAIDAEGGGPGGQV